MCGRLNIIDDPLCHIVSETLGINFFAATNTDLCPSQLVATVTGINHDFHQVDASWGIQPNWSNRLLINAKAETVNEKATFKSAFSHSRCLVPCSGWYEWKTENGKKVKYLFSDNNQQPFYMAGLLYNPGSPQVVTLTTTPNKKCSEIHHRMPVLIQPNNIDYWFNASVAELPPLFDALDDEQIQIKKV